MTWQTSKYPANTEICPHCGIKCGDSFDFHEALVHPDKRIVPEEYKQWLANQANNKKKTKTKK